MVKIPVQTTEGTKYEDVYNVYEFEPHFDFDILSIKKGKMNYCTVFGTFDIETNIKISKSETSVSVYTLWIYVSLAILYQ